MLEKPLYSLNRQLDPTSAITKLYTQMSKDARVTFDLVNLGQGIVTRIPEGPIKAVFDEAAPFPLSGTYPRPGGPLDLCRIAADRTNRFLGTAIEQDNMFVFRTPSRASLLTAFLLAAKEADERGLRSTIIMPDMHWTMYDALLDMARARKRIFDIEQEEPDEALWEDMKNTPGINGFVSNYPNNPTGKHMSSEKFGAFLDRLEDINVERTEKKWCPIRLFVDIPYILACEQTNGEGPLLINHVQEIFKRKSLVTPWYIIDSESKSGAVAGKLHRVAVHPHYANEFCAAANLSYSSGMDDAFEHKLATVWSPDYDAAWMNHYADLKRHFTVNRQEMETAFPAERIVKGEPNVLALLKGPQDMFDKAPTLIDSARYDGHSYLIENADDLVEYAALEHGVFFVNGGLSIHDEPLFRVSLNPSLEQFKHGITVLRDVLSAIDTSFTLTNG